MKLPQNSRIKGTVFLLLLLSFGLNSCKKSGSKESTDDQSSGPAKVIVQMLGIDETYEPLVPTNGAVSGKLASVNKITNQALSSVDIQTQVVPFNEDYLIEATLVPEGSPVVSEPAGGTQGRIAAVRPVTKAAANVITQTPLTTGVKYRVVVYDAAGNYVISKDFVRGSEGTDGIALDDGKTYTFVAYSVNSTTALPDAGLTAASTLSTSNLTDVSGDLMYFSKQMPVVAGDNNLGIILKHKYNLITPKVILDDTMIGNIDAISNVAFGGTTSPSADMNLGTGVLTYNTDYVLTAAASFTGIGTKTVTGSPILVINKGASATPSAGTSRLAIGSITIAGVTRTGLSITGLTIMPGVKYNLNLTIHRNCNASILLINTIPNELNLPTLGTTSGTTVSQTRTYPFLQNQGPFTRIVFYIKQTTSAFDIMVNNVHLITNGNNAADHYFHFNNSSTAGEVTNVTFADGTKYGTGGIDPIESLSGTSAIIQIDVVVGTAGTLIAASKTTNGGLLSGNKLLSPYHFNSINWNQTADNTVTITQQKTTSVPAPFFQAKTGGITSPCTN